MAKQNGKSMVDREFAIEQKRLERSQRIKQRIVWFDQRIAAGVKMTANARVAFAAQTLRDQIVVNIGKPVKKYRVHIRGKTKGGGKSRSATRVDPSSRSKPGEFPRVDTSRLLKDIFWDKVGDGSKAIVGTTLDYGLILEVFMDRSFILRTYEEMKGELAKILGTDAGGRFRVP